MVAILLFSNGQWFRGDCSLIRLLTFRRSSPQCSCTPVGYTWAATCSTFGSLAITSKTVLAISSFWFSICFAVLPRQLHNSPSVPAQTCRTSELREQSLVCLALTFCFSREDR